MPPLFLFSHSSLLSISLSSRHTLSFAQAPPPSLRSLSLHPSTSLSDGEIIFLPCSSLLPLSLSHILYPSCHFSLSHVVKEICLIRLPLSLLIFLSHVLLSLFLISTEHFPRACFPLPLLSPPHASQYFFLSHFLSISPSCSISFLSHEPMFKVDP